MEVLAGYGITSTLHEKTFQEELHVIIKLCGSNCLFQPLPFPSVHTPPSRHTGQSVHMAYHVCMVWVATLSFFPVNIFDSKTPSQYYFSVVVGNLLAGRLGCSDSPQSTSFVQVILPSRFLLLYSSCNITQVLLMNQNAVAPGAILPGHRSA